jgi:hypothetical protein
MSLAMELILTPLIKDLMEKRQQLNTPEANWNLEDLWASLTKG